jgi:hypothetical protein
MPARKAPTRTVIRLRGFQDGRELHVVPGGRLAYLWIGHEPGQCFGYVSGPATLRRLARAILREVGSRGNISRPASGKGRKRRSK